MDLADLRKHEPIAAWTWAELATPGEYEVQGLKGGAVRLPLVQPLR